MSDIGRTLHKKRNPALLSKLWKKPKRSAASCYARPIPWR